MTTLTAPARPAPVSSLNGQADPGPLCAAHTPNFPALLRQLSASLLVTTYQAGKLVMVRGEGDQLNTHYRAFQSPMGLALADGGARFAIGTTIQVWEFRDVRDVTGRLEPAGKHDACYLPRSSHVTGNVLIHEMAYGVRGQGSGVRSQESGVRGQESGERIQRWVRAAERETINLDPRLLTPDS